MTLDTNNILIRFLIACAAYYLLGAAIDFLVKDPESNRIFKVVLLFICLAIVFVAGFFVRL